MVDIKSCRCAWTHTCARTHIHTHKSHNCHNIFVDELIGNSEFTPVSYVWISPSVSQAGSWLGIIGFGYPESTQYTSALPLDSLTLPGISLYYISWDFIFMHMIVFSACMFVFPTSALPVEVRELESLGLELQTIASLLLLYVLGMTPVLWKTTISPAPFSSERHTFLQGGCFKKGTLSS